MLFGGRKDKSADFEQKAVLYTRQKVSAPSLTSLQSTVNEICKSMQVDSSGVTFFSRDFSTDVDLPQEFDTLWDESMGIFEPQLIVSLPELETPQMPAMGYDTHIISCEANSIVVGWKSTLPITLIRLSWGSYSSANGTVTPIETKFIQNVSSFAIRNLSPDTIYGISAEIINDQGLPPFESKIYARTLSHPLAQEEEKMNQPISTKGRLSNSKRAHSQPFHGSIPPPPVVSPSAPPPPIHPPTGSSAPVWHASPSAGPISLPPPPPIQEIPFGMSAEEHANYLAALKLQEEFNGAGAAAPEVNPFEVKRTPSESFSWLDEAQIEEQRKIMEEFERQKREREDPEIQRLKRAAEEAERERLRAENSQLNLANLWPLDPPSIVNLTPNECAVCMCSYEPDETVVRLPCVHAYHKDCITEWLSENPICPVCQFEYTLIS